MSNRPDIFWKLQSEPDNFFPKDFKELFQLMVSPIPANRPSIPKILEHPWITDGEMPTKEEITAHFALKQIPK